MAEEPQELQVMIGNGKSHPSSEPSSDIAITLRHAYKSYGRSTRVNVLMGLNMTIPKGAIYGLLGMRRSKDK